ncbi:MAG: DUF1573 domain-containing protein [Deltaproteobacteria bacterium]|jgi:hypothetical protein|nr:DUF1573 domain-containing protein [Deltaproteobacteria bacterium]
MKNFKFLLALSAGLAFSLLPAYNSTLLAQTNAQSEGNRPKVLVQTDPNDGPVAQPLNMQSEGQGAPIISMSELEYQAGEVDPSTTISYQFLVKNEGTGDLIINKVVPGCGCSVASFSGLIPPGGVGKVTLSVDIYAEWAGHDLKKSAVIMSNDPANPDTRITIKAKVRGNQAG